LKHTDAEKDSRFSAKKLVGRKLGVFDCFPASFQEQTLLRIKTHRLTRRDAKKMGVEILDRSKETAGSRVYFVGCVGIRIVKVIDVPPVIWNLGDSVHST